MLRLLLRILIALASSGWIIPLCLSFWASYDWMFEVMWMAKGQYQGSWHPVDRADEAFYFGMGWLFIVVVSWSFYLTGRTQSKRERD